MNFNNPSRSVPLNIAVIGSGISGLSAAWLLSKTHSVTVYEQAQRVGGHSNTVTVRTPDHDVGVKRPVPVDTGFIVYNEVNYPNLVALFDHLDVPTQPSDMSFAVSLDRKKLEYSSRGLNALFGQRRNIVNPRFWYMVNDLRRFYRDGERFLSGLGVDHSQTLGGFLSDGGYGAEFINRFILPMGAAIWSTRAEEMREQPALTFIRFFKSHGLLGFTDQVAWRTVSGGSREYVKRLTADYAGRIHLGCGAVAISRQPQGVEVTDASGALHRHDAVVIATHADHALMMLTDPDPQEQKILGAFRYTDNRVILHADDRLMPTRRRVWSSWNYMGDRDGVSVSYWMNSLQGIDPQNQLFVTVNPLEEPAQSLTHQIFNYQHPFFDLAAWRAQEKLWKLQGRNNTWFCGSYFWYGFHEDALQAGLAVAEELGGIKRPWSVPDESGRIHCHPAPYPHLVAA